MMYNNSTANNSIKSVLFACENVPIGTNSFSVGVSIDSGTITIPEYNYPHVCIWEV